MNRKVITTDQAPKAIGPYSQAIQVDAGKMTFFSGQIPLDPATGELVKGDITAEINRVMENLKNVIEASGMTLENVVRCGIFLTDLGDFAKVNEVYAKYFTANPPARSTIQVAALPKGARVEVEAITVS